ncbi:MAG TPA: hypothetical protein VFV98_16425, partial [Vicinamibacterales bacterium]|nr:hypothetical protein [Vicinamibacterales bacterium]
MRVIRIWIVPAGLLTTLLWSSPASAQVPVAPPVQPAAVTEVRDELERLRKEFDAIRKAYDERLLALEQRLTQIGGGPLSPAEAAAPLAPPPALVAPQEPQPQAPISAAPTQSSKIFNPDTSVIGNFVGVGGKNPFNTQPAFQLSEAEVSFQAIVDPYARADFFLSAGPEGLDVEEGYITFTSLPA